MIAAVLQRHRAVTAGHQAIGNAQPVGRIAADDRFGAIDWESLATEWAGQHDQSRAHDNPVAIKQKHCRALSECQLCGTERSQTGYTTCRPLRWSDDSSAPHRPACSWSSSASAALLTLFAGSHPDRVTGDSGQQLPQLVHADPDRDRRELLRDHGRRRHHRDHLRRDRPLGRVDLRAGRRDDGDGAARRTRRSRRWRTAAARPRHLGRRRPALRRGQRPDGGRPRRPSVHHHARDDVDPARDRVRGQQRREHRAAAGADGDRQGAARARRVAVSGADAGDAGGHGRSARSICSGR